MAGHKAKPLLGALLSWLPFVASAGLAADRPPPNVARHKICCNDPPDGIDRAAMHPFIQHAPTVPRLLGQAGYSSLQTGEFWEGHFANAGFTSGMTTKGRHGDDGLIIGRKTMQPIYDFIEAHRRQPFFIWYARRSWKNSEVARRLRGNCANEPCDGFGVLTD